jgi:hypothetical protein
MSPGYKLGNELRSETSNDLRNELHGLVELETG